MAMRLKRLIDQFLEWCENTRKPATTANYRWLLRKFSAAVGNPPIDQLKPVHLTSYAKTWHEVQAVQRLMQWAKDDLEIVDRNVFARVKRPPAGQRTRILSPVELLAYLRRCRLAYRRFLLGMRETIARPQEIRALRWEQLQAELPRQSIEEALRSGRAIFVMREYKARARRLDPSVPRVLLVTRRLGRLLLRLRRRLGPNPTGPVFLNSQGRAWSSNAVRCCMRRLRRHFRNDKDPAERIVTYSLRHSIATIAVALGVRDRVLADLMGHASTRTTARYQHLQVEHLRPAMDLIECAGRQSKRASR